MAKPNLKSILIFSGLKDEDLEKLSQKAKEYKFGDGDTIIKEGKIEKKEDRRMYVITEGEVEVLKEDWTMNQVRVNTLKQGSFFGEMSLIDNEPRSSTVSALSDTVLYSLSHEDLRSSLSQEGYTKVILNIGGEMAKRIRGEFSSLADLLKEMKFA